MWGKNEIWRKINKNYLAILWRDFHLNTRWVKSPLHISKFDWKNLVNGVRVISTKILLIGSPWPIVQGTYPLITCECRRVARFLYLWIRCTHFVEFVDVIFKWCGFPYVYPVLVWTTAFGHLVSNTSDVCVL